MKRIEIFTNLIKDELTSHVDRRDPSTISMSSLGHCMRSLAYRYHEIPGKPLGWRTMMVFKDGDMGHAQLRMLMYNRLQGAGYCHKLVDEEAEVCLDGVVGHIDGFLKHDPDCKFTGPMHKDFLLELKTMNDRAFAELKKHEEVGLEYRCQISGYLAALDIDQAIVIAKNKNTGELLEFIYDGEDELVLDRITKLDSVIQSKDPESVAREYGPNKSGSLPWQCNYCPFTELCWREEGVTMKKEKKYIVNMDLVNKQKTIKEINKVLNEEQPLPTEGCT